MSTRSSIRIRERGLTDGASVSIYCHWDGYIAFNGVVLQLYYNTPEKVEELYYCLMKFTAIKTKSSRCGKMKTLM